MKKNQKRQLKTLLEKLHVVASWLLLFNLIAFGWPGRALAASGGGMLSYGENAGSIGEKYRTWTPSTYSIQNSGPTITCSSGDPTTNWTVLKSSPSNVGVYVLAVMYTCATPGTYFVQVWSYSGGSWTSEWSDSPSSGQMSYRGVDLAFENVTGNVLVTYLLAADTDRIYYQEGSWNGSDYNWSANSFTDATIGNFRWLRLVNKLNFDQMLLAATGDDGTNQVNAWIWDAADPGAFGNEGGNGGWGLINGTADNMDAAYETSSGNGLVAWGVSASPYYRYATWTQGTTTWSDDLAGPGLPGSTDTAIRNFALAANPNPSSDRIAMGAIENTTSDDIQSGFWNGATDAWANTAELDTAAYSPATNMGRGIDVAYAGTTNNSILVFSDAAANVVDWARSVGEAAAFTVQADYDPTPTFNTKEVEALVPDASGSNVIQLVFLDTDMDLVSFYYDDDTPGWAEAVPSPNDLDADNSATTNPVKENFMFAWESVYKVPTLTEILFLALIGCIVFLGIKTGAIKIRKNGSVDPKDISAQGRSSFGRQEPPIKQLPIENSRRNNHQTHYINQKSEIRNPKRVVSIDGISRREINKN